MTQPVAARPELSVIIATHRGEATLGSALESLAAQSLEPERFEVVVVLNGEPDSSPQLVDRFRRAQPRLTVRSLRVRRADAAHARNWGVAAAAGEHVTFVDDDDLVAPRFLEVLMDHVGPGVVPVAYISDVTEGEALPDPYAPADNYFNAVLLEHSGTTIPVLGASPALSSNAAKVIPRTVALSHPYRNLRSSEDAVFWSTIFARTEFQFAVVPRDSGAVYYRGVRPNSASRQPMSFDFNVSQRLDCIEALSQVEPIGPAGLEVITGKVRMQARVIRDYLETNPSERDEVIAAVRARGIRNFPYFIVNQGKATRLAILYAFAPFQDTSALVAARRIRQRGQIVDVVSNNLDQVRAFDELSAELSAEFIDEHRELDAGQAFSNWRIMQKFTTLALPQIARMEARKGHNYESVYSRAMWGASQVAAAVYKLRNPSVRWEAELSDPLLKNIHGEPRQDLCTEGDLLQELRSGIRAAGFDPPDHLMLWEWIEATTYALADDIVFTNHNQREYMLGYCYSRELAQRARSLSVIEYQPTLAAAFYHEIETSYAVDPQLANIAYFGVFYPTRGFADIAGAFASLAPQERTRVRLHLFTNDPVESRVVVDALGLGDVITVNGYRPYLEFLNLTTRFDVLLVQDANTKGTHACNPYLPSKMSDYLGSATAVWAIVEEGSVLSTISTKYRSKLGETTGSTSVLSAIVQTFAAETEVQYRPPGELPDQ